MLHLHPLTLEDILQQDPREKLELFPKLGYYFISFRAIESRNTRERRRAQAKGDSQDESIVSEVNVYLVVFREGVCSVSAHCMCLVRKYDINGLWLVPLL